MEIFPTSHFNLIDLLRHTFCTRLLYTVLPAPYTKRAFYDLLQALVEDLNAMSTDGITATRTLREPC